MRAEQLLPLYYAQSIEGACNALSITAASIVECAAVVIAFTPQSYRRYFHVYPDSNAALQESVRKYATWVYTKDLWHERSPSGPHIPIVRHSDYTPSELLIKSVYYEECLKPVGILHGASITAWDGDVWLSILTLFKSQSDGDFTDSEMAKLRLLQPHYNRVINYYSTLARYEVRIQSLQTYIESSDSAFILIDWDGEVIHINRAAKWKTLKFVVGGDSLKPEPTFRVPDQIRVRLEKLKTEINQESRAPSEATEVIPLEDSINCRLSFFPSRAGSLHPGLFLVTMESKKGLASSPHARKLSRAELIVYRLLAEGLSNDQIATRLGKTIGTVKKQVHSMFRKFKVFSRSELVHVLDLMDV